MKEGFEKFLREEGDRAHEKESRVVVLTLSIPRWAWFLLDGYIEESEEDYSVFLAALLEDKIKEHMSFALKEVVGDAPQPPYVGKVIAAMKSGKLKPSSALLEATVLHDDGCPVMRGTGGCACDPKVIVDGVEL